MSVGYPAAPAGLTGNWLCRFAPAIEPWARLVCFPHAGGTAAFYRPWREYLTPGLELYAVQYPGRMNRINDACIGDMDLMADSATAALLPLLDRPVALFGHSVGAVIAYEVARRLPPRACGRLVRLFVSGRAAPERERPAAKHRASDDVLWEEITRLGGTRSELLADPELRRAFLPALRSDYRISELYRPRPGPPLDCPVTALLGDRDTEVTEPEAQPWAERTTADFRIRVFPGDHFYLTPAMPEVIAEVMRGLAGCASAAYPGWAGP